MSTTTLAPLKAVTPEIASANILAFAEEGRLEQHKWRGRGGDGREIACLLGSIHPGLNDPRDCPAALMPEWMANLTMRLFDGIGRENVRTYGLAYGRSVARWGAIDPDGWSRIRRHFVGAVFMNAAESARAYQPETPHPYWPKVEALIAQAQPLFADNATTPVQFGQFSADAWALRNELWDIRWAALRKARDAASGGGGTPAAEAVEAAAEAEAEAAAAEAVAAAVAVAVAVAAVAVAVAVAVEAAAEAVAVVARAKSYEASFDLLLKTIDAELDRAA